MKIRLLRKIIMFNCHKKRNATDQWDHHSYQIRLVEESENNLGSNLDPAKFEVSGVFWKEYLDSKWKQACSSVRKTQCNYCDIHQILWRLILCHILKVETEVSHIRAQLSQSSSLVQSQKALGIGSKFVHSIQTTLFANIFGRKLLNIFGDIPGQATLEMCDHHKINTKCQWFVNKWLLGV